MSSVRLYKCEMKLLYAHSFVYSNMDVMICLFHFPTAKLAHACPRGRNRRVEGTTFPVELFLRSWQCTHILFRGANDTLSPGQPEVSFTNPCHHSRHFAMPVQQSKLPMKTLAVMLLEPPIKRITVFPFPNKKSLEQCRFHGSNDMYNE